jgi:dTMP kinase
MNGKFIVFEGVEGCGKTSQIQRIQEWLHSLNISTIVTREPGGTELGLHLRQLLLESGATAIADRTELFLYAADRSQHIDRVIKPALAEGKVVLCDRYTDSTIAYQGWGRGISLDTIEQINVLATNGLQSDVTILLDINPEVSFNRILAKRKLDRMEQADLTFHHRVRQGFLSLAEKFPERIVVINGDREMDKVTADIQQLLTGLGIGD